MPQLRQKLLILYLYNPDLNSPVVAWSLYDGTTQPKPGEESAYATQSGSEEKPPYSSVVDAMRAGWRVIQFPAQFPAYPGTEYQTSYLKYEYILEKLEEVDVSG